MSRISYCIANWKMNHTSDSIKQFINDLESIDSFKSDVKTIICPSYVHLYLVQNFLFESNIEIGSQNVSEFDLGAFTGEVSANMLKDIGVRYVILGHSERRHLFSETNKQINCKLNAVIKNDLEPILCIGETLEQRKDGDTEKVLREQLNSMFNKIVDLSKVSIVAYEPVWAIGTGIAADLETINSTHKLIRKILNNCGLQSDAISLLYGGSVIPENCSEIFKLEHVDGFLIGGASLKPETFTKIYIKMKIIRNNYS